MREKLAICAFLLVMAGALNAQKTINLWNNTPPTDSKLTTKETVHDNGGWITDVSKAELYVYLPEKAGQNRMAVIICPGGGYGGLAINHEGHQVAKWLNTQGIVGVVLKYRMPKKHKQVPLEDAQQAIRYVREHAQELGIDVNKVGIAGFSAGGHLAATASTHYQTKGTSTRPDFSILFYPVITMGDETHEGSRINLLGDKPSTSEINIFSNEKQVNSNTPPAILLLSDDDKVVPPVNSTMYYEALKKNDIPATMYIFPEGDHGWGMGENFKYHSQMLALLKSWLDNINK